MEAKGDPSHSCLDYSVGNKSIRTKDRTELKEENKGLAKNLEDFEEIYKRQIKELKEQNGEEITVTKEEIQCLKHEINEKFTDIKEQDKVGSELVVKNLMTFF